MALAKSVIFVESCMKRITRKRILRIHREHSDTIVRCKHRERCQNMINYLAEKREEIFK